nr:nucleotidyltransferase [Hymenolepis microstoma]
MIDSISKNTQDQDAHFLKNPKDLIPLWRPEGTIYSPGIIGLHEEIKDFGNYIAPSHEEQWARQVLVTKLRNLIISIWRNCYFDVFGSFSTGLYLPTSDIDVVISGKWQNLPLRSLERALQACNFASDIKVLSKATVPIVKFTDIETGLRVDISFNMTNSLEAARFVTNQLCCYPFLRYLVFTLKQFLLTHELNEVFTGGISSYALILMCISFLKDKSMEKSKEEPNLGSILIDFLYFYGTQFNYKTTGISASGQYIPKESISQHPGDSSPSPLVIDDPICPGNNVTRRSYSALNVLKSFREAFDILNEKLSTGCDENDSILSSIISIQPSTIEARNTLKRRALELFQLLPSFVVPNIIHRKPLLPPPPHLVPPSKPSTASRSPESTTPADQNVAASTASSPKEQQIIISARGFTTRPPAFLRAPNSADVLYLTQSPPPYGFFPPPVFYDTLCFPVTPQPNPTPIGAPSTNPPVYVVFPQHVLSPSFANWGVNAAYPPMHQQQQSTGTASSTDSETQNVPDCLYDCDGISDAELLNSSCVGEESSEDCQPPKNVETVERNYKTCRSASVSNTCSNLVKRLAPLRLYSSEQNVSCVHENHDLNSSCQFSSLSMLPSSSSVSSTKSKNCNGGSQLMDAESPQSPPPSSQTRKSGQRKRRTCRKNGCSTSGVDSNIPNSSEQRVSHPVNSFSSSRTSGCYISSNEETEEVGSSSVPSVRKTKRRCSQLHSLESSNNNKGKVSNPKAWSSFKSSVCRMDSISPEHDKVLMASPNPMPMTTITAKKVMKGKQQQQSNKSAMLTGSLKRLSNRA